MVWPPSINQDSSEPEKKQNRYEDHANPLNSCPNDPQINLLYHDRIEM